MRTIMTNAALQGMLIVALLAAGCPGQGQSTTDRPALPGVISQTIRPAWSLVMGGTTTCTAVTALPGGDVIVAGTFAGDMSLGEVTLRAAGKEDGFVARLDRQGRVLWARALGGSGTTGVAALAARAGGGVVAAVRTGITITIDGHMLRAPGEPGVLLVALKSDGGLDWARPLMSSRYAHVTGMTTLEEDGSVVIAGGFFGTLRSGDRVVTSAGAGDGFVARIAGSGDTMWLVRAGGAHSDVVNSVAAGPGIIVVAGAFSEEAAFGPLTLTANGAGQSRRPAQDAFVAALRPDGAFAWARGFGRRSAETAQAAAVGPEGTIYVAGSFGELLALDEHVLTGRGESDGFVAALDSTGRVQWANSLGGPGRDMAHVLAVTRDGPVIAGTFENRAAMAEHELVAAGAHDGFVAWLDRTGRVSRVHRFGGPDHETVTDIATTSRDQVVLTGTLTGAADFFGTPLQPAGEVSGFVTILGQ